MSSKYYNLEYSFSSSLNDIEGKRYLTTYTANVYELDFEKEGETLIGKFTVKQILVGLAMNERYPIHDVIDMEEYTFQVGQDIFDIETNDLKEDIQEFYNFDSLNTDVCILTRIEIKESHRGKGIGKKIIKDAYCRFSSSCGLFVVQAFPLQFEKKMKSGELGELPTWSKKMNFSSLETDFEKAFYQLKAFYQKIGFDHIDGYDDLMFLNTALVSEKMNKIQFE